MAKLPLEAERSGHAAAVSRHQRRPRAAPGAGRSWHYMVFCSRCGARPALPLPKGEALCRLHGGRLPQAAERWSMGASSGSWNIALPDSRRRPAGRPWTVEEDRLVLEAAGRGELLAVAEQIDRTRKAVQMRCYALRKGGRATAAETAT